MQNCQDLFEVNEIVERDIDLLLLEEFVSSSEFRKFFLEKTEYPSVLQLEKAKVSVREESRESDLIVWLKSNATKIVYLIENKINASMQHKQVEDYHKRGENLIGVEDVTDYKTILISPENYSYAPPQDSSFDFNHRIYYEDIRDWIKTSTLSYSRKRYKLSLLQSAIDKQKKDTDWGVKNPCEVVTKFWRGYWELARTIAPEFNMKEPEQKGSESTYIYFMRAKGLPDGAVLVHKIMTWKGKAQKSDVDFFDLQFSKTSPDELRTRYGVRLEDGKNNAHIHESTDIVKSGKSASIRIKTPPLDVYKDFHTQINDCKEAISLGRELLRYFGNE